MLELNDLRLAYGKTTVVHGLSMSIEKGEAVALVGPNGAGKTTTLSAICGLVRPAGGTIRFEDSDIGGRSTEKLVRKGIALVPEGRHIFATLTVEENLRLPTADMGRAEAAEAIEAEIKRFPFLRDRLSHPAGGLSGGQQQQLAIARALLCRPRLLLLDEPSLGLAPLLVDLVFETLEDLRREGVTILLVEQNAVRAAEFADRSYVLSSGSMVLSGTREELRGSDALTASYLGASTV